MSSMFCQLDTHWAMVAYGVRVVHDTQRRKTIASERPENPGDVTRSGGPLINETEQLPSFLYGLFSKVWQEDWRRVLEKNCIDDYEEARWRASDTGRGR